MRITTETQRQERMGQGVPFAIACKHIKLYQKTPPQQLPSREIPIALCHSILILKGEWGRAEPSETFELSFLKQSTKYLLIIPHNSALSMEK